MTRSLLTSLCAVALCACFIGCDSGGSGDAKKPLGDSALTAPAGAAGRAENDEGIAHYDKGHWDVAEEHFRKAIQANEKLAEAHYNLGLTLDKQGKHDQASAAFKVALDLAPGNPAIKDSVILKEHTGS